MIFKSNFYVYYADTDAGGVVYHSKYLDFCEKCRTDFLRENGMLKADGTTSAIISFFVLL